HLSGGQVVVGSNPATPTKSVWNNGLDHAVRAVFLCVRYAATLPFRTPACLVDSTGLPPGGTPVIAPGMRALGPACCKGDRLRAHHWVSRTRAPYRPDVVPAYACAGLEETRHAAMVELDRDGTGGRGGHVAGAGAGIAGRAG